MKLIRLIIALYILAISVYPCSDDNTCVDERKAGMAIVDHTNHSSSEQDGCSPLCICSCCAAHVQLRSGTLLVTANPLHNTAIVTPYLEGPMLSSSNSIWQPPRI